MRKWIAYLLALACLLSLCACSTEEDADEEKKEKYVTVYLESKVVYEDGKVCTLTYDENGNQTSSVCTKDGEEINRFTWAYDDDNNQIDVYKKYGEDSHRWTYTYDEDGKQIECVEYIDGEENCHTTFAYDKDGNQIEAVVYRNGEEPERYTYAYDKKGNLIEEKYYSYGQEQSYSTYVYDEEDYIVTEYYYHKYGTEYELNEIIVTTYDDQDRIIKKAYYDPDDEDCLDKAEPISMYTYVYEDDKLVERARYYDGELENHETHKYNEQGDIISMIYIYYEDGYVGSRYEYEYEYTYDEEGNIIQRKCYYNGEYKEEASWTCTYIKVKLTRKRAKELGYI